MPRPSRMSFALSLLAIAFALVGPATAGAAPAAPPASATVVDRCGDRSREQARSAHVERVASGVHRLGGCVADVAGIAHLFLEWETTDGRTSGRICTDPRVIGDAWQCPWDTTSLEPGTYVVRMTAVDPAGNVGNVRQAYRVVRESQPPAPADPPPATTPAPSQDVPAPPRDSAPPTEPEVDPGPALPDAEPPTLPEDGLEPPAPVAPPVSPPLAQFIAEQLDQCARLGLAPDVVADRALSLAVLECMRLALEASGATELMLDEIPVPPAIRASFPDHVTLAAAQELLPDTIGGVDLQLTLAGASDDTVDALAAATVDRRSATPSATG